MSSAGGTRKSSVNVLPVNMGVGYQGYQVLSPKVWGWVTADLVLLFPCYSLNPTFLPLI